MRLGIVGAGGYWGQKLLQAADNVVDFDVSHFAARSGPGRSHTAIERAQPELRQPPVGLSPEDLLSSREIDALIVASPAETHHSFVKGALLNDKHVFVEKPLCLSTREAEELVHLAKARERVLFVDHTYLFSKCLEHIRARVDKGLIGEPLFLHSNRQMTGRKRAHGVLWDLLPHDLSILFYLFPDRPIEAMSLISWPRPAVGASDGAVAQAAHYALDFARGFQASGFVSWLHPRWSRDTAVVGRRGMLLFEANATVRFFESEPSEAAEPGGKDWKLQEEYQPDDDPLENALTTFRELTARPRAEIPEHLSPDFALRIVTVIEELERSAAKPTA